MPENSSVEDMHLDSGLILSLISFPFIAFLYWKNLKEVQIADDESNDSVNSDEDDEMEKVFKYVSIAMVGVIGHAFGHFLIFECDKSTYGDGRGVVLSVQAGLCVCVRFSATQCKVKTLEYLI